MLRALGLAVGEAEVQQKGPAMVFVRSVEAELTPDKLDDLAGALRPANESLSHNEGYFGLSLLANRASSAVVVLTYWQSADARHA